jgi:2-methylcitrate dehydratase PrpD
MSRAGDLSRRLSEHVAGARFEDLPAAAVEAAKRSLLDAVGVMLGASGLGEGCAAFADLAQASGGPPECTLLGHGVRAPLLLAALANGAAAHALDFEDAFDAAPTHPNAQLIPAILALAEQRGASGRDVLTAIAVGCDLVCRLALTVQDEPARRGWYTPPIVGAFGAAAASAKLLGLDAAQVRDALSLTLCQATCSAEIKYSAKSVIRAVRDGFAAHAGLLAALLAQRGVAGFEAPLEGKAGFLALYAPDADSAPLTADLGGHFFGADVSFKPWPSCRGTHAFIEAALAFRAHDGVRPEDVLAVETCGGPIQSMLAEPHAQKIAPLTAIDAKFSIPFTVATALVRGQVGLDDFAVDRLRDSRVLDLAARVGFSTWAAAPPEDASSGATALILRGGSRVVRSISQPRGHPTNPMDWDELEAKFRACAGRAARPPASAFIERFTKDVRQLEAVREFGAFISDS